jgi:hypothetical protein
MNDLSFLRCVDLRDVDAFVIEKDVHLIEEELMGVGIGYVEAEVIDELLLFCLPFGPAIFADLGTDLLSKLGRYRRITDRLTFLSAPRAFEFVISE